MEMPQRAGFLLKQFFISGTPFFDIIPQNSKGFKQNIYEETLAFLAVKWYFICIVNRKAMTKKVA